MVDKVFYRTLDTGLTNEIIIQEVAGFLEIMFNLEEEYLIQFMNKVTMKEEERSSKLVKGYRIACVQESEAPELSKKWILSKGKCR